MVRELLCREFSVGRSVLFMQVISEDGRSVERGKNDDVGLRISGSQPQSLFSPKGKSSEIRSWHWKCTCHSVVTRVEAIAHSILLGTSRIHNDGRSGRRVLTFSFPRSSA